MKRTNSLLFLYLIPIIAILILTNPEASLSSDQPFNNISNWGGTGLMEIPNARVLEDGVVRLSGAQALPYRWISGGMGILPGFELSGRLTAITNISALSDAYGAYKDKAFDLKYQLIPESRGLPAVAFGINDFWGTRLFPSEYLVMSRQIYPFDFTFGIGSKRFSGGSVKFFNGDYSLFGGFELELSDRFLFMAEYNPIKYENDKPSTRGVPEGAKYPVNIGLRAKLIEGINIGISFQRGDTFGLSLDVTSLLGEQILPQAADPPLLLPVDRRSFDEREKKEIIKGIYNAVKQAGFENIAVYTNGKNIICEFENSKYLSNQKAAGRVLRLLLFHSPEDTELLIAVMKSDNIPILKVSVKPDHMDKFILGDIPEETFLDKLLKVEVTDKIIEPEDNDYLRIADDAGFDYDYGIKPALDIYWNDPSGFFKFSVGVNPYVKMDFWKGASAYVRFSIPFYSNITSPSTEELPSDVIRSDIAKYKNDNYTFDRLIFNQTFRLSDRLFSRVSLGYFDIMYAGIGGEGLYFFGEGKMALGIEGDWVKKRYPNELFKLMDVERYTVLGNAYYYYSGLDMTMKTQFGRFLAGDVGWKIDINRRYQTGAILGMFVTFTDTTDIDQPYFNDGYNHKGVYLRVPVRMFYSHDSNRMFNYGISPWTRDVGQTVFHWKDLFGLVGNLMPAKFENESSELGR